MCLSVSEVGANLRAADGTRVIDARGKLVMPGQLLCNLLTNCS